MRRTITAIAVCIAVVAVQPHAAPPPQAPRHVPAMAQFMSAAWPDELVAAKKAERIAWVANDKGLRNVYTAAAPDFKPERVTSFLKDDGVTTTQLTISDDGATVTFTRGAE